MVLLSLPILICRSSWSPYSHRAVISSPKEMGEMVREVNQKEVARDEILSDRVYEFDREKRQLRQIPESIEKEKEMER